MVENLSIVVRPSSVLEAPAAAAFAARGQRTLQRTNREHKAHIEGMVNAARSRFAYTHLSIALLQRPKEPTAFICNGEVMTIDFEPSDLQRSLRDAVNKICARFDDDYWLQRDRDGKFPHEFHKELASEGWLGVCIPEAYGGSGLGITEAAIMMEAISASGAGFSGASSVHMNIFGLNPVVLYGSEEQRCRMLPPIVTGKEKACFAVTEPNAGLETAKLQTRAERRGDRYVMHGTKTWISTAQVADKMLILVRTAPPEAGRKPTDGLSLFYTALDRRFVEVREIEKMGRHAVDSNLLFIDGLEVPVEDRIGEEGRGFEYILHGMNPERILIAAEAVGLGRAALKRATAYAKERIVFDRPIGKNQAIQHPLAECWMELEAANLMVFKAARQYDNGIACGPAANTAKYLAAEAGFKACQTAVMTHGGYGYAREYHVERYLRESMIPRIAPVSPQLILCFIAEKVLGLPKSY
jgi:acyl-CoA dehydrogenase